MNLAEISALADGLAPVIRDLMGKATEPLIARIDSLEAALAEARAVDHVSTIRAAVDEAVAALPAAAGQPRRRAGAAPVPDAPARSRRPPALTPSFPPPAGWAKVEPVSPTGSLPYRACPDR